MKNLITGGAGFIGSNLIEKLINNGEEVICIDNLSSGFESNIKKWIDNPKFKFIYEDIINPVNIKADRIWHLACPGSPKQYQKDPIKTANTIVLGTLNMLKLATKNKSRILIASSSEIYGQPKNNPQSEFDMGRLENLNKRSCYAEGKRFSETLGYEYNRNFNTDVRIARIFNTYGKNMQVNDGRVISNFISQNLRGQPLTIYGDGSQTRSFCFIDDLLDGMEKLMDSKYVKPINLGSDEEISINGLCDIIRGKINPSIKKIQKPLPEGDPNIRKPDLKLASDILRWEPKTKLKKGLGYTINSFKEIMVY